MPFARKSDVQSYKPPTDVKKLFVGRMNELHFFVENILKPDEPSHNLLSVWGQGGVGKTTLVNRYVEEARTTYFKDYCLTALVDERQTTPVNVMERFADQLCIAGEFEKALGRYKESLRKLQSEREAPRDAVLRKATTEVAGSVVKTIPVVGNILNQGFELAVGQMWDEFHYHQLLKDAKRLENSISGLTKAFVHELNALANTQVVLSTKRSKRQRRILLCFDTFEQLATEIVPWLLDHFLVMDISPNVVLVIAGRIPLERSLPDNPKRWLPYQNVIHPMSLEGFSEGETRKYLIERDITDASHIETIWRLSRGLPLYLALLTSNPQGTVDPTADVVANFLRWIPEQEQAKRKLVLDAALLSRPFNQDELEAFSYLSEQERPALYRWLRAQPFIHSNPEDGRQSYHELAQELFSRHLHQLSPSRCYATRRSLVEYYQKQLKSIEAEGDKDIYHTAQWLELTLALAYQLFLLPNEASHIKAIEQIVNASLHTEQTEEIVRMLRSLSQGQQNSQITVGARQTAKHLLRCVESDKEVDQELFIAFDYLLGKVTLDPSFSKEALASIHDTRGDGYSGLEQYEQAIADYDRAIYLDPNNPVYYSDRGSAYSNLEQYEQAIADYDRAIGLSPSNPIYHFKRGSICYGLKRYQQAIADYDHAIDLDPNNAVLYSNRGRAYSHLKEYQQALADHDSAIALDPKYISAYNRRGNVYSNLEHYQQAIANYNHAIDLDPNNAVLYFNRGWAYFNLKEYHQAIADYDRAIDLDPGDAIHYFNRGWAYFNLKEYQQAIADYDRAIDLDPGDAAYYSSRGKAYYRLKEYPQAIADYNRAIYLDPYDAVYYSSQGDVYSSLKKFQQAIANYDRAINLDPCEARRYSNRGKAYYRLKEYPQAIADYDRAIDLDPSNAACYSNRGNVYFDLKKFQQAIADYGQAIDLNPCEAIYYSNRGHVYSHLKEYQQALADHNRALELDPNYAIYYSNRGHVYSHLKEYQQALADHNRALELDPDFAGGYASRGFTYLWLKDIGRALADYVRSWELDSTDIYRGWMVEWLRMCQERLSLTTGERLEAFAAVDAQGYLSYVCRGVARWIGGNSDQALIELELAIPLDEEMRDAYFWKGMVCASLGKDEEAMAVVEKALELGLPPLLLAPLRWFEVDRREFYEKYAISLLARYDF